MVFSSLLFLFGFLPLVLGAYYLAPRRARNAVLFASSLLFYAFGEPRYVFVMLLSLTFAFLFGFPIAKYRQSDPARARRAMQCSIFLNLAVLIFFKYVPFLSETIASFFPSWEVPAFLRVLLPIGISFYTFQIISYTVDLYRGDCELQKNYLLFGTYVTLFPQLVAGPIVRYREIDDALSGRRETLAMFSHGALRFSVGLAKKVLLGDPLAAGYEYYRTLAETTPTRLGAWMTVILYSLHLYFDFSGYSDMALGLGELFGFRFPENFRYPYTACSVSEFWRRWHISLSSWFREYVYIPLGGNRRGLLLTCRNLLIVWTLTGIWHGAGWNFLLWGLYYALILIAEKCFLLRALERTPMILRRLYTLLLVLFGFVLFSAPDLTGAGTLFRALFGRGVVGFSSSLALYQLLRLLPLLFLSLIGATPLPRRIALRILERRPAWGRGIPLACLALVLLCTAYLVDSTYSPFEYFNF